MTKAESKRVKETTVEFPLVVTISMSPREARARKRASSQIDGVRFTFMTRDKFIAQGGNPNNLPEGKVVGITRADNLGPLKRYNIIVKDLLENNHRNQARQMKKVSYLKQSQAF